MGNKYKIVKRDFIIHKGKKLYRIEALKEFNTSVGMTIRRGEIGGYVEGYHNLSQEGDCWIFHDAKAYSNARVKNSARIGGNAEVYGNAIIKDHACILEFAKVFGNAEVSSCSLVTDHAKIYGNARVIDESFSGLRSLKIKNSTILDDVIVCGNSVINSSTLAENAKVYGNAKINQITARDNIRVYDNTVVGECKSRSSIIINDNSELYGNASIILQNIGARFCGNSKIRDNSSINYFSKSIKLLKIVKADVDCKTNFRDHDEEGKV